MLTLQQKSTHRSTFLIVTAFCSFNKRLDYQWFANAKHGFEESTHICTSFYLCHPNQAAVEDGKSDMDVKEIMDTWTLQMGYPVVTITRDYDRADGVIQFNATQERFLLNPDNPDANTQE